MKVRQIRAGHDNFSYLIWDGPSGRAAVVDPSYGLEKVAEAASEEGLEFEYIIITHGHSDHYGDLARAREVTGGMSVAHSSSRLDPDVPVKDGDILQLGGTDMEIIHTPGHTPDGICVLADMNLFTGDTLFVGECGRTDLPGGDSRALYHSLFDGLMDLEDDVEVWPGHDYGPRPRSTMGYERAHNYVLEPRTEEEFVQFMLEP